MPDDPHPQPRSRGPAAGRLWSGQAGPEAPAPPPPASRPPAEQPSIFNGSAADRPRPERPAASAERPGAADPAPRRRGRSVWPAAFAGGAASGVAAALAALAIAGGLDDDRTSERPQAAPPAVSASAGARSSGAGRSVGAIYAAASPAVASVQSAQGSGTGFLIDGDGTVVTNAHVVGGAREVLVRFGDDGRTVRGRVTGRDSGSDIAVVKVDESAVEGVEPLRLADSSEVKVGDLAVAIGNPLGLPQTATAGIVSGLERSIQAPDGFTIDEVIQTDAPINPGNSGGPLLDARGRVIGINSQIATAGAGSGNIGIGFAVPSNTIEEVVPLLEQGRTVERPWLGVSTSETQNSIGAQVREVVPGSPAARAGLRPGDVITGVDGRPVTNPDDVASAITDREPGDRVSVEIRGEGDVEVTLDERPASARTGG